MLGRRRYTLFFAILRFTLVSLLAAAVTIFIFYQITLTTERDRLAESVQHQVRLIEALALFNATPRRLVPDGEAPDLAELTPEQRRQIGEATLATLRAAHSRFQGFGESSRLQIVRRKGDKIEFLLHSTPLGPQATLDIPAVTQIDQPGQALQRSLMGQTGTLTGYDPSGRLVLAAYAPVPRFGWGVVASVELREISAPFVQAGLFAAGTSIVVVLFGAAFLAMSSPLILRLEETEVRAQDIVAHAGEGILTLDETGRIQSFNPAAAAMFGYQVEQVLGQSIATLLPVELAAAASSEQQPEPPALAESTDELGSNGRRKIPTAGEGIGQRQDGSRFPMLLGVSRVEVREQCTYTLIVRDISRQKADEQALRAYASELERINRELSRSKQAAEAAARAKSEFLANVSHEIRTPLNAILGLTELALDDGRENWQPQHLTAVRTAAGALLRLVNDLLDFSKLEAQRMTLNHEPFDLPLLVDETVQVLSISAARKGLTLSSTIDPRVPPRLIGDAGRLQQVLLNLLDNAVKFTLEGAVFLDVAVRQQTETTVDLQFRVRDTGIGIPPERQQAIFEAFTQADGSTTRRFGGTGLGLAITAQLVRLYGGQISVASAAGNGTTFTFTAHFEILPEAAPRPEHVPAASPLLNTDLGWVGHDPSNLPVEALPRALGRALRVLLAEDNFLNQQVAAGWLERWGHHVEIVTNGRAAVQAVASSQFDLVLLDIQMPDLDGLAAATQIRQLAVEYATTVPIVAMTAHSAAEQRQACLDAGMDDFLTKPIRPEQLAATLALWAKVKLEVVDATSETAVSEAAANPTEPARASSAKNGFELSLALSHCGGSAVVLRQIAELFLREWPNRRATFAQALSDGPAETIAELAHTIKGSASYFATSELLVRAKQVEEAARAGERDKAVQGGQTLLTALDGLVEGLEGWLAPQPADV